MKKTDVVVGSVYAIVRNGALPTAERDPLRFGVSLVRVTGGFEPGVLANSRWPGSPRRYEKPAGFPFEVVIAGSFDGMGAALRVGRVQARDLVPLVEFEGLAARHRQWAERVAQTEQRWSDAARSLAELRRLGLVEGWRMAGDRLVVTFEPHRAPEVAFMFAAAASRGV